MTPRDSLRSHGSGPRFQRHCHKGIDNGFANPGLCFLLEVASMVAGRSSACGLTDAPAPHRWIAARGGVRVTS